MKNSMLSLVAAIAFAVSFVSAGAAQDCASQGGIVIHPAQGVELSQVTYSFVEVVANIGLLPSSTAEVDIDVEQLQAQINGGFLNVVTPAGWVGQNIPILPANNDSYYLATTINLNVAAGIPVSSLNATVCYSAAPLTQITSRNFDSYPVGTTQYNGEGFGTQAMSIIPSAPPVGALSFNGNGAIYWYIQGLHNWNTTDVQTANNQCAPASVANSYAWLDLRWNVPIPDQNIMGLRNQVQGSLVGAMDLDMNSCNNAPNGRWAFDRAWGVAVPALSHLQGSMEYLSNNNINNLTLKHQGLSPFPCDGFNGGANYPYLGLNSLGQGQRVDPNFIYNEVSRDSAVEYDAVWYNQIGQPAGGHAMDIIASGSFLGLPWIYYVSDHLQTLCTQRINKVCQNFQGDDKGTTYTMNGNTKMLVDFSFLVPTAGQPQLVFGQMNGAYAVAVLTQHP